QEPGRTATLAYDAVALIAALVKTQGPQRFSQQVLTNPSGFTGIDGLFRFRTDGTNERGFAVLRVSSAGKPDSVTRSCPAGVVSMKPCSCNMAMRSACSGRPAIAA